MPGNAFIVEGSVTDALPNGTFLARLANGHRLTAFLAGRDREVFAGTIRPGDKVKLQLTPYDLSMGRVLVPKKSHL